MSPELFAAVFVIGMFSGVFIIYMGLKQRSQQLEMHHRERMAMIERGQIPLADPETLHVRRIANSGPSSRYLSLGIIVVGLGLAIAMIISVAAETPEVGIGVGGSIAILGGAFIVRSILVRPDLQPPAADSTKSRTLPDDRL